MKSKLEDIQMPSFPQGLLSRNSRQTDPKNAGKYVYKMCKQILRVRSPSMSLALTLT